MDCPFCQVIENREYARESLRSVSFLDNYPIFEGHTLVIPKRHTPDLFDLSSSEISDLWYLVAMCQKDLSKTYKTTSFNVGINIGADAGQTINHLHVHLIPRKKGDVPDPRGGIRWINPDLANYWD